MRVLLVLVWLVACERGSHDKPAMAPPPPAPAPALGPPLPCGELTCTGSDVCISTERAGGVAPAPGERSRVAVRHACGPAMSQDDHCTPVEDRHQRCFEEIPSAAPARH